MVLSNCLTIKIFISKSKMHYIFKIVKLVFGFFKMAYLRINILFAELANYK